MELRIWCLLAAFCVGIVSAATPSRRDAFNNQRQQRPSRRTFSAEEQGDYDLPTNSEPQAEDESTPKPSSYSRRVDGASNIGRIRSRTGRARATDTAYDTLQKFEKSQLNTEEKKTESSDAPTSYAEVQNPNTRLRSKGNLRLSSNRKKTVDSVDANVTVSGTTPAIVENRRASISNTRSRSRQATRSTTSTTTVEPEITSPNIDESEIEIINSNLEDISAMTFKDQDLVVLKTEKEENPPEDPGNLLNPLKPSASAADTISNPTRSRVRVRTDRRNLQVTQSDQTTRASLASSEKLLEATTKSTEDAKSSVPTASSGPGGVISNSRRLRFKQRQDGFSSNAAEQNVPQIKNPVSFSETVRNPIRTDHQDINKNAENPRRRSFTRRAQSPNASTETLVTSTESSNVSKRVPSRGRTNFRPRADTLKTSDSNSEIKAEDNYPASFKALLKAKTSTLSDNSDSEQLVTRSSQIVQKVVLPSAVDDSSNAVSVSKPKFTRRRLFKPPAVASRRSDKVEEENFDAKPSSTTSTPRKFSRSRPSYSSRLRQSTTAAKATDATPTLDSATTTKPKYKYNRQQKSFSPRSFESSQRNKDSAEPNDKPVDRIKFQRPNVVRSNYLTRPKTTSTEKPESLDVLDNTVVPLDIDTATPIVDTSARADYSAVDRSDVTSDAQDISENESKPSKYHSRYKSGGGRNNIVLPPRKSFTVTKSSAEIAKIAHRNLYRGRSTTPSSPINRQKGNVIKKEDNADNLSKTTEATPKKFSPSSFKRRRPFSARYRAPATSTAPPTFQTTVPLPSTAADLGEDNEINSDLNIMSYSQTRSTISSDDLKLSESVWTPAHTPMVETSHYTSSATISIFEALADILTSTPKSTTIQSDIGVSNPITSATTKPVQSEMETESTVVVTNDVTTTTPRSRTPFATLILYSTTLSPPLTTDLLTTHSSEAPSSTETLSTVFNTKSISDLILSLNTNVSSELTSMLSNNIRDIMINMDDGLRSKVTVDMDEILKSLTTTPLTPSSEFDSTSFTLSPDVFTDTSITATVPPSSTNLIVDSTVTQIPIETTLPMSTETTTPSIDVPISTVASFIMNYNFDSVTQSAPIEEPRNMFTEYPSTSETKPSSETSITVITEVGPTTEYIVPPTMQPLFTTTATPLILSVNNSFLDDFPSQSTTVGEVSSLENSQIQSTTVGDSPLEDSSLDNSQTQSTTVSDSSLDNSQTQSTTVSDSSLDNSKTQSTTVSDSSLDNSQTQTTTVSDSSLDISQTQSTTEDSIENVISMLTSIENNPNDRQGRVKTLDKTAVDDFLTNTGSPPSNTSQEQTVNNAQSPLLSLLQSLSSTNNDVIVKDPCIVSPAELWGLSRGAKLLKVIEEMIKQNNIESVTTLSPSTIADNISNRQAKKILNTEVPSMTVPDASASTPAREEFTSTPLDFSTENSLMTVTNLSLNTDSSTDGTTTTSSNSVAITTAADDFITTDNLNLTTVPTVQQTVATESSTTTGNTESIISNFESTTFMTTVEARTSLELPTFDESLLTTDPPFTTTNLASPNLVGTFPADVNPDEALATTEPVSAATENMIPTMDTLITTAEISTTTDILTTTDNPTTAEILVEMTTNIPTTANVEINETKVIPTPQPSSSTTPTYSWVPPFPTAWRNSLGVSASPTPVKKDYFIFGILSNNTVVRKNPNDDTSESLTEASPYIIFGVLPNNTVVRKFPNGTRVPRFMQKIEVLPIDPRSLRNPLHPIYRTPALIKPISNPIQEITTNDITSQTLTPEVTIDDSVSTESLNRAAIEAQLNGVNVNNTQQMMSSSLAPTININDTNKNVNTDSSLTTITTEKTIDTTSNVVSLLTTAKLPSIDEILLNSIALATMEEQNKASMVTSTREPRILTLDIDPETKRIRTESPTEENGNAVFKFIPINNNIQESDRSSNVFKLEKPIATNAPSLNTENIVGSTTDIEELSTSVTPTTASTTSILTTTQSIMTTTTLVPTTSTTTTEPTTTEFIPPSTTKTKTMTTPFERQTTINAPQTFSPGRRPTTTTDDLATTSTLISMVTDNLVTMTTDSPVTFQSRRVAENEQSVTTNRPTTSTYSVADDIAFLKSLKMYVNPDDADHEASLANRIIALAVERSLSELTPNKTSADRTPKTINGHQLPVTTPRTTTTTATTIQTTHFIEDDLRQYEADTKLLQALLSATGKSPASFNLPSLLNTQQGKFPTTTTQTTTTQGSTTITPSLEDDIIQYEKDAKLLQALLKATGQSTNGLNIPSFAGLNTLQIIQKPIITTTTSTTTPKPTTITIRRTTPTIETRQTSLSIEDDIRQYQEDAKLLQALLKVTGQSTGGLNIPSLARLNTQKPIISTTTTTTSTTEKTTTTQQTTRPATSKPTISIENDIRQFQEDAKLLQALLSATGQSPANPNVLGTNLRTRPLKVPDNVKSDLEILQNLLASPSPLNTDEVNEQLLKRLADKARQPSRATIDSKPDNSDSQLRVKPLDGTTTTRRTVTTTTLKPLISDDIKNFEDDKKLLQTLLKLQTTGSSKLPVNNKVAATGFSGDETLAALLAQEEKEKPLTKSPMPLSTEFGKTNDALLAALLKEQGFSPTTPGSLDEQLKFAVVVTPRSKMTTTSTDTPSPPPPRAARPLLDGLSWLWTQWQETAPTTSVRRPRPAPIGAGGGGAGGAGSWFGSGPFTGNAEDPPASATRVTNGNRVTLQPTRGAGTSGAGTAPASERPQLVSAAINVTRAFSQFLGAAIQGAAATVQNVIKAGQRAANDMYSAGSG